jgi:hypothetical protein
MCLSKLWDWTRVDHKSLCLFESIQIEVTRSYALIHVRFKLIVHYIFYLSMTGVRFLRCIKLSEVSPFSTRWICSCEVKNKSWQCDWSAKKFLLFYCLQEQICPVENGLYKTSVQRSCNGHLLLFQCYYSRRPEPKGVVKGELINIPCWFGTDPPNFADCRIITWKVLCNCSVEIPLQGMKV